MSLSHSHWGLCDFSDSTGRYEAPCPPNQSLDAQVILTPSGEILVRKDARQPEPFCAAVLLIDKGQQGLSPAQTAAMQQVWNTAMALCSGAADSILLQPVQSSWRYNRSHYQPATAWQPDGNITIARCAANNSYATVFHNAGGHS